MKHSCTGMATFLAESNEKRHTTVSVRKAQDSSESLLLIDYQGTVKGNLVYFGWGMRFTHCPFCGKKLKSGK